MSGAPTLPMTALCLVLQLATTASAAEHRLPRPDEDIREALARSLVFDSSGRPTALAEARARDRSMQDKALATFTVGNAADGACDFNDIQSAIDAAAANGPALDFIRIANNQSYTGLSLTIDSQDLAIFGGYDDCSDTTPEGQTTLRGSSGSVLLITAAVEGYGVTLRDLVVQEGSASGGGGILVQNGVRVDLDNVRVSANDAVIGGGILALTGADLHLLPGSLVNGNDAVKGGGIYCDGSSVEIRYGASVYENEATEWGGGIMADGCTVTSRAGPVSPFLLGIVLNHAGQFGGGILADNGSQIELRGTASSTALVAENTAAATDLIFFNSGAGVLLANGSSMDARNASIVDNRTLGPNSVGGIAVASGSSLVMDRLPDQSCNAGGRCSEISRNSAAGCAALYVVDATAEIRQTFIEGNIASVRNAICIFGNGTALLEGVVFAGNRWTNFFGDNSGITIGAAASATVAFFTAWGNMDAADEGLFGAPFYDEANPIDLELYSSIIDESVGTLFGTHDPVTSVVDLDCLLVRYDDPTLDPYTTFTVLVGDPKLTFPAAGNFHLKPTSPAIDFCDNGVYTPVSSDIDGEARGFDMAGKPDVLGPYDLGADEALPVPDPIFSDGFESGDSSAWSTIVP